MKVHGVYLPLQLLFNRYLNSYRSRDVPSRLFRIFLSVLRDGFMASVTWRPRLIQIRLPCAKRLGDVLRLLLLKKRERC